MIEIKRNFLQGVMNRDVDPHFLPDGQIRHGENIIINDSEGSNNGIAKNYLGNTRVSADFGLTNATTIGTCAYEAKNLIYWLVASDEADLIAEYNDTNQTTTIVIKATKSTPTSVSKLGFDKRYLVTGINYINGLLFWTDNNMPPRKINIERAKNYAVDGFTDEDINVIVKPPLTSPTIALSSSGESNNLEDKFLYFSYRYKYLDNEYSSLAPFSAVAFFPKTYKFDYGVSENVSMVNNFNTAAITYNKGGKNVVEVQLVFRDSKSVNTYIIDNINTATLGPDVYQTYTFKNNKIYAILPQDQVNRMFDEVPLKAQSQTIVGNRLIYGDFTRYFDLVDANGNPIEPNFSLSLTTSTPTAGVPKPTFKSNRDYEIGIVYLDDYGRSSTVIVPKNNTNTLFIPASNADTANNIRITIDKDFTPPAFATDYRFYIKQNKMDYYNVFPLTYFTDGQFKWFLINEADRDKISVGSYVYLKQSNVDSADIKYKILDLESKSINFLNNDGGQPAGVYFKIKISSGDLPSTYQYNFTNVTTDPTQVPITNRFDVAENPIFYGVGLNDMITSFGNATIPVLFDYDVRFTIQIDSNSGIGDTFKVFAFYDNTYNLVSGTENTLITAGVDQVLQIKISGFTYDICKIQFASASGHNIGDYWTVNCRMGTHNIFGGKIVNSGAPYGFVTGTEWNPSGVFTSDRAIEAGAVITIKMKEPNNGNKQSIQTFISTRRYENIEEWFIEDSVYSKWIQVEGANSIGPKNVGFRRIVSFSNLSGTQYQGSQGSSIGATSRSAPVFMFIYGFNTGSTPNMEVIFSLSESLSPFIFETEGLSTEQDIYYETSKTYRIVNGAHQGNVTNQVIGTTNGVVDLNKFTQNSDFNAFCWGNNVESFRIRDAWNSAKMEFSPRVSAIIENYSEQRITQALTWSEIYVLSTGINRLNEFNASLGNIKFLDLSFGSVQKLYARDTDLVVFQENKISKVLYGKNLLSDSIGGGSITAIPEVLGTQIAYAGDWGIGFNPESFAVWGNQIYFADARRGAIMRLSLDGLFEISSIGFKNWFKSNLNPFTQKIGIFDPYFEHYIISNNNKSIVTCNFEIAQSVLNFSLSGGSLKIYIKSNSQWVVNNPVDDWVTVDKHYGSGNGFVLVTIGANATSRSSVLVISGCGGSKNIIIQQGTPEPTTTFGPTTTSGPTTTPAPTTVGPTTTPAPTTTLPPTPGIGVDFVYTLI